VIVLLDAYAVIAILRGEPAAEEVASVLENGLALIHPLNLAEVIDRMVRLARADPDEVEGDVAVLGIRTTEPNSEDLVDAGRWKARHYHRVDRAVSLADCVAAITAVRAELPLATSDPPCAAMVREEGGTVLALPDSTGARPVSGP
jgi:PIN domain nuclease of toxin-antitoxin system